MIRNTESETRIKLAEAEANVLHLRSRRLTHLDLSIRANALQHLANFAFVPGGLERADHGLDLLFA